jgi:hypothetical protein
VALKYVVETTKKRAVEEAVEVDLVETENGTGEQVFFYWCPPLIIRRSGIIRFKYGKLMRVEGQERSGTCKLVVEYYMEERHCCTHRLCH